MNILGKTGLKVFPIGYGGVAAMTDDAELVKREVQKSIDVGVNYFDVAPTYGNAQQMLGPALEPFRRDVYLACKTHERTAQGAKEQLDESMELLKTDYFDVYQLHGIVDVEKDVKAVFAKGGAMEPILDAKKAGIIRNIGFSTHTVEAGLAAMDMFDFDTAMFAVNFVCHFNNGFEVKLLEEAHKRNMGVIALKSMAKCSWKGQDDPDKKDYPKSWYRPIEDPELARLALSWTMSQEGVGVVLPPGHNYCYNLALDVYDKCGPLSEDEIDKLKAVAKDQDEIFPVKS